MAKKKIKVQDIDVRYDTDGYVCITDIAKQSGDEPRFIVRNWMSTRGTILYLGEWEKNYNPSFKGAGFRTFRDEFFEKPFSATPSKWIEQTNAIGIRSTKGRYGGTFAQEEIALNFCYWLSPAFQVYFIKEFKRLKEQEAQKLGNSWTVRRELAKANHLLHTDAVRDNRVPIVAYGTKREAIAQASEADLLNLALFGQTARQWRNAHPNATGNIRDQASVLELAILANLEIINAELMEQGISQQERLNVLKMRAAYQKERLPESEAMRRLSEKANRRLK
ncbi:MAG: KilA-N domain-containing protein [Bacteroidota bacterium]